MRDIFDGMTESCHIYAVENGANVFLFADVVQEIHTGLLRYADDSLIASIHPAVDDLQPPLATSTVVRTMLCSE